MQPPLRMLGLLMLMFSLCDADSRCHPNPLTLEPTEVIGQYGELVTANCSSPSDIHNGIHWRVGNITSPVDYDNSFVFWEFQLSDWDASAECKIQMTNDTHGDYDCSNELEIIIYSMPDQPIVFPTKHIAAALEGTPYVLQCNVDDVAPVKNLSVRWYRDDQIIKTDVFTNATKTPVSESSTLEVNISRKDNGAQFRCEAQLDFGPVRFLPPISSEIHTVSVHYAPELKNKTEDVYVNDYSDVNLSCEAEGRPLPVFHWTCDGLNVSGNMNNLNITEVRTSTTCYCTAKNYLGNSTKEINVHVMKSTTPALPAAPAAPTSIATPESTISKGCPVVLTPAEIVVQFGDTASANCSTSEDILGMGWEATSGGTGFETGPTVQWTVESVRAWDINATCYITRNDNTQCSSSATVTVYKTPDSVTVSTTDPMPMEEGKKYELDCDIINVAPVQKLKVKWYRDDHFVQAAELNLISKTPESVTSTLVVTPERDYNGAFYRCQAELQLGPTGPDQVNLTVTSLPFIAVVLYKPVITDCPGKYTGEEHKFSLDMLPCKFDGNPSPAVQWYYEGKLVSAFVPLIRNKAGRYTAEVVNHLGRSSTSVDITIEYGPMFACAYNYDIEEKGKLPCEPEGEPKPHITWYKDGTKIDPPQYLTKDHSGKYLLQATNNHGTANHTLTLNILYAPVFKEGSFHLELSPGQNVTLDCNADGNPLPEILWSGSNEENVRFTTRGSQKSITIIGATSTNTGVYNCTATNGVGKVTRSVTLMMKGKTSRASFKDFWWILLILLLVVILLLLFFAHNQSKKHGRYSFIPDRANESSNIPMTPQSNGVHT